MPLDAPSFQSWLRSHLPGFGEAIVIDIALVDGGVSNITCRVDLDYAPGPAVALRLQRERGIFEPYDVIREGEVIRRLAASDVPVPRLLAAEAGPSALGAPFLVLEWVDAPHMGEAPDASFAAFTEMVARIHAVDWRVLGLDFLGVPESAQAALTGELTAIELRRKRLAGAQEPLLGRAGPILRATVPTDGKLAFCQGDINVYNYLFRHGQVAAVVDWEQARISDPRSDIGQMLALSNLKGAAFGPADSQGFALAYGASTGEALHGMAWFRARWLWELGVMYHSWLDFSGSTPWYTHDVLTDLLESALAEIASHG